MNDKEQLAKQAADYYREGNLKEARESLEKLLELNVESPALFNQLGNICQKQTHFSDAEKYYQQALTLQPDYLDAMYNLALVLRKQEKAEEAMAALVSVLDVAPHYYQAHYLLGRLLLEKKMPQEADLHFREIAKLAQENEPILRNIVAALLEHDAYKHAQYYCEKLIKLNPNDAEVLYNLGVIFARRCDLEKAKDYYHRVLNAEAKHFSTLNNLAVIYLEQQNFEAAKTYFQQALVLQPDNDAIQYTLSAISGDQQHEQAPKNYITTLFDQYANKYDMHLREGLEYQVPELLKQALEKVLKPKEPAYNILDLGCGTGLAGEAFQDWSKELVGVDLSEGMLEQAKEKKLYQKIILDDCQHYLVACDQQFDLMLAADVFIYIGDLGALFKGAAEHLNEKGCFAFSIELTEKGDYQTQLSGRFSHSEQYIRRLAKESGFKIKCFDAAVTRKQRQESVPGAIIVLQKP